MYFVYLVYLCILSRPDRPRARKNVLNAERLRKAEEKLEREIYSSRDFLRAVTYSFNISNKKYFDEWAAEEWAAMEDNSDSDDSDQEVAAPELFQDSEDDEILLQPQTQNTVLCFICEDREPDVFLVPCGHQNVCGPCAYGVKENSGLCPFDRKEITHIVPKIPL